MTPRATYRVQFHADFPFGAAVPLVGYWKRLGISHLYASPIAAARQGSTHGYDVVDPTRINPELGGEAGFRDLVAALKAEGLGVIIDIVPNHLAVGHGDNRWWLDMLADGPASAHAHIFDVDWEARDGKILLPFLGTSYDEALRSGNLALKRIEGQWAVVAYDRHVFPLRPQDQGDAAAIHDADGLDALIARQHWRLGWWRTAGDAINWRRFFDITELAGIRVEDERVFDWVHALPLRLYREGLIDGVRVDHIDGLSDPAGYGRRLRHALGDDAYIVVEKILAHGERLTDDWGVDGTSGYDFMNAVSAVLHDPAAGPPLGALWHALSGRPADFAIEERAARHELLDRSFAAQLDACATAFQRLASSDRTTADLPMPALRRACRRLIGAFPAYRTYGGASPLLDDATARARAEAGPSEADMVERVARWLAGEGPGDNALRADAARRFFQLAAPIAAKAVEDTAFYRYGRLLSRNDVGCDPGRLGEGAVAFLAEAAKRPPHAMLATATHDHKRGEDLRMRLAVLSEIPDRWMDRARRWAGDVPHDIDRGDAAMLHQMIVGAWPVDLALDDHNGIAAFAERLAGWQVKALREAKLRSAWTVPDEAYEGRCADYLHSQLGGSRGAELQGFALSIAPAGFAKSLVQAGLRCTLPGVPDLFQGREGWDLSLVDPDNRRPVAYDRLIPMLDRDPASWTDGASKQRLIAQLLALRPSGPLEPLVLTGRRAHDALAFRRGALVVVAALRASQACIARRSPDPGEDWWEETQIIVGSKHLRAVDIAGSRSFGVRA
jgi:(1->4)-alpha-D-glucan 1-alpha-D-glucosylmutase